MSFWILIVLAVVQAGVGTDGIGRFDITVDTKNNCVSDYKWQFLPIVPENCPRDEEIDNIRASYKTVTDVKYNRVISRFKRKLTHPDRFRETELGNLFCDILAERLGIDVMLLASGSIRGEELGPVVQYRNLTECFPYDGKVNMLTVSGEQLRSMLEEESNDKIIEKAARERLGYIYSDEQIFVDISGN